MLDAHDHTLGEGAVAGLRSGVSYGPAGATGAHSNAMADFRFNVSDSYLIPLRGWMLRLKLVDGTFEPRMLAPGTRFKLVAPDGEERVVSVKGLSVTGGRQNQERVDRYKEFDLVVPAEDGVVDGREVGIGWKAVPA